MSIKTDVNIKRLFEIDEWNLIENKLPDNEFDNKLSESITSLGNEYMGMRGNFEERFSGPTHQGTYLGGIWYPDKTVVGWWKNGYPNYFGKAINSINHVGLNITINENFELDLNVQKPITYKRTLDMYNGELIRNFVTIVNGVSLNVEARRFFSLATKELCAIQYSITPEQDCIIDVDSYLYGDVINNDSNYNEKFWTNIFSGVDNETQWIHSKLKSNNYKIERFEVCAKSILKTNLKPIGFVKEKQELFASTIQKFKLKAKQELKINKFIVIANSLNVKPDELKKFTDELLNKIKNYTYDELFLEHKNIWNERWKKCDVKIFGSPIDQQAIRFNLFHLFCTYFGNDERLNIGPKGFTGEKYGGATYWDTEAYCVPLYLKTSNQSVAKALLKYRYNQLDKAIENAKKLGLKGALFPMVTFNGEECHNEWEITFEEIHRNAAIVHAIYNYVNYTGDDEYIEKYGIDVMIEVSKFWASRVHWNENKKLFMIHGVTGPNEYENNINNNWLTNLMAKWTLDFTLESIKKINIDIKKYNLTNDDLKQFENISKNMFVPYDKDKKIFIQNDCFLDKELKSKDFLDKNERPLNKNWSWDKILRSVYIKQADVLQGIYYLYQNFTTEEIKNNFEFYEPFTVHESSLSPCIHSIIAARLGFLDKAYEFYSRTARLDLDNYNNDSDDGLHITSMTGSYLAIVEGFAGMIVKNGIPHFNPKVPKEWKGYQFIINFRNRLLEIEVNEGKFKIKILEGEKLTINVFEKDIEIEKNFIVDLK